LQRFMDKKRIYHIVTWLVAIAACVFLAWKIATYEDYASLGECLRRMGAPQWWAIALCVALMPVNMGLEAWRWMTLMNEGANEPTKERLDFREAQRQVYYSKLAGLITPWRLGEYPARGVLMDGDAVWGKVLSMGAVGSATMTIAIVLAGVLGLAFSPEVLSYLGGSYLYALLAITLVLLLMLALAPRALKRYAEVNSDLMIRNTCQSLVRVACWCVQLALIIYALGGTDISGFAGTLLKAPVYYLFVTITPNIPIVEVSVRGAWAIAVFGTMNAALSGVLLWAINTLLPCLIWPFLRKNEK
jgi:hypothetical protein